MKIENRILRGTFILTLSGLLSRFIGFFYRVFLSRSIGAEGVGLYQLIFPLYMLAYSITVSGIQSAISRIVASKSALFDHRGAIRTVWIGVSLSFFLSVPISVLLFFFSDPLSVFFLNNRQTAPLLQIMAFAVPFGSFHACIDGFYYGIQRTSIPATRQFLEQVFRFLLLILFRFEFFSFDCEVSPSTAVLILVMEEIFAALFSFTAFFLHCMRRNLLSMQNFMHRRSLLFVPSELHNFILTAIPLSGNRTMICILQSMEASLLPFCLQLSGYSSNESLRIYGILSGMALPMILFPTAVTSSLSTMILPSVSAAQTSGSYGRIRKIIYKSIFSCLGIGILFSIFFLFLGKPLTSLLFHNELAGYYVQAFAFISPMLYLNPILFSILNGLGKSSSVFFYNLFCMILRLFFVMIIVPKLGISGYFSGLFFSQLLCNFLCIRHLQKLH